jgi:hypothetical protein
LQGPLHCVRLTPKTNHGKGWGAKPPTLSRGIVGGKRPPGPSKLAKSSSGALINSGRTLGSASFGARPTSQAHEPCRLRKLRELRELPDPAGGEACVRTLRGGWVAGRGLRLASGPYWFGWFAGLADYWTLRGVRTLRGGGGGVAGLVEFWCRLVFVGSEFFDGAASLSPNSGSFEIRVCPCEALVYWAGLMDGF